MDGVEAIRGGRVVARETGRGIGPALKLYRAGAFERAEVRDRIVGRAAAALFVAGGAERVHADVMSAGAATFLAAHGIPASAEATVSEIINRKGTGPCPMEEAVRDLDDPVLMIAAIERTLAQLAAR